MAHNTTPPPNALSADPVLKEARENINDALKAAYWTIAGADVDIDAQTGFDKFAEQWQVENAINESYVKLNENAEAGIEGAEEARDEVFKLMQEVEANRAVLDDAGVDVAMIAMADNPLKNEGKQEYGDVVTERSSGIEQGAALAVVNTAAVAAATDAKGAAEVVKLSGEAADISGGEGQGAAIVRGAHQCYLLYNMHYFAPFHRTAIKSSLVRVKDPGKEMKAKYQPPDAEGNYQTSGYDKMLLMKEEPDTTTAINSLLACGGDEAFSKITTAEYAQLQPLLKIYKIYASKDKGNLAAHQPGIVEIEFATGTNIDGIAKQLTSQHPPPSETEYKSWSRGANSGVQSFEWRFLGTDPFTATRDVEATLKISIQHFSELIKLRQGENLGGGDKKTLSYRYVDLLVQPDCRDTSGKEEADSKRSNPECYEVRVDVGYQDPSLSGQTTLSKGIKDSIACQRQSLYLTLVDHKFEFKNDGTIGVVITFRGRLGTVMRDKKFNILMPGGGFKDIVFTNPDNPDGKLQILRDVEDAQMDARTAVPPDKEKIKKLQRYKNIFFVNKKQSLYNGILSRLQKAGMVFSREMTPQEWIVFSQWQQEDKLAQTSLPEPLSGPTKIQTGDVNDAQVFNQAANTDVDAEGVSDANIDLEEHLEGNRDRLAKNKGKIKRIQYVFLGDLLAVVFQNATGQDGNFESIKTDGWFSDSTTVPATETAGSLRHQALIDKFHIILGNIDVSLARPNGQEEFTCNLAHIPVSLEVFRQFWTEKVLMKDIVFYSFFQFLDDMVQDMLTQALSSGCFDGLIDQAVRSHTVIANSAEPINPEVYKIVDGEAIPAKAVHAFESSPATPAFKKAISPGTPGANDQPANPWQYLIVQASEQSPSNLAGDYTGDINRGILHFGYGRDRGLLKTVSFEKTNQEYLPEARYASEGNFVFNQLANVYDATFTMIGNNLFSPGKYIYFDTSDLGMGSPPERVEDADGNVTHRSWANIMGLGGYHLVTEISNTIDRNGYNTSVKARWTTSGVSDQITGGSA
jgi:hypothetical protein